MKRVLIVCAAALLSTLACATCRSVGTLPTPTPTEDVPPTETKDPKDTPTPTLTPTVTDTPTVTLTPTVTDTPQPPTPTQIAPLPAENLFGNGAFEGEYRYVLVVSEEDYPSQYHFVAQNWWPWYCDEPYTPEKCPAPMRPPNADDLLMRRPEYKLNTLAARARSGRSQQWFCFSGTCEAGVYQSVPTTPGVVYETGAYVQAWSNYEGDFNSELNTDDDWANTEFTIRVNLAGDTFAFSEANVECLRVKGSSFQGTGSTGFYDQFYRISCQFRANSSETTVFFGSLRNWPISNNDSYIDDAYLVEVQS